MTKQSLPAMFSICDKSRKYLSETFVRIEKKNTSDLRFCGSDSDFQLLGEIFHYLKFCFGQKHTERLRATVLTAGAHSSFP